MKMKIEITRIVLFFLLFTLLIGCENPSEYEHTPLLVVNGELVAGHSIDSIFVTWSTDISNKYNTEEQQVRGADVRINGLQLREYEYSPGVYYYPDPSYRVITGETYYLEITIGDYRVTSETRVPESFQMIPANVADGDTVRYVPGTSFFSEAFFTLTWPGYTDSQIFRIVSLAKEATAENFIEDDRNEAKIFKGEVEDRLNPTIWWVGDDYARINWMYFNWTGWHDVIVSAVDSNYYDYRNGVLFGEQSVGQNFNSTIGGGYGLFYSSASDTIRIYLVE
ncbi:MAG: hypothetical protein AMS23_00500 [Bacteroides sp. SM1_62]|jgi:hypothetical protein|nr:MAG: hypothetical protein AMS23_00500 [Bacteroides sp. SM1_62]